MALTRIETKQPPEPKCSLSLLSPSPFSLLCSHKGQIGSSQAWLSVTLEVRQFPPHPLPNAREKESDWSSHGPISGETVGRARTSHSEKEHDCRIRVGCQGACPRPEGPFLLLGVKVHQVNFLCYCILITML